MIDAAIIAAAVLAAVLAGWAVPALALRGLMPALDRGRTARNYRGRDVALGLGIVWLVWAAASRLLVATFMLPVPAALIAPASVLVAGAFGFGLVDDVFGDAKAKGFRGHMRALGEGRLTTGALKLFGIGGLSLAAAILGRFTPTRSGLGSTLATWACATLVIALSANLVNLTDLRPGRALKAYCGLVTIGLVAIAIAGLDSGSFGTPGSRVWAVLLPVASALSLVVLLFGPVLAVWRFDLGERGMLGDAGANAAGALAGYVLASGLPLAGMAVAAALLLALNVASERVSFSRVIEGNAVLRWIDGLGRLPADDEAGCEGDDRYADTGKDGVS